MQKINNEVYNNYGDRWYTADDDPVALLRAESKAKNPWIIEKIKSHHSLSEVTKVLDVGCGAGFLTNDLARVGLHVTGVDLSAESLNVAKKYDATKKVQYLMADAYQLPFADKSFEVVTALDFLEHVERPQEIIKEFSRVLKPGGIFIFHTFNRNLLSYFIIIKLVEWLVKNTPKNMHVINLFIKPSELKQYSLNANMKVISLVGLRPVLSSIPFKNFFSGIVPKSLEFTYTKSLFLSYMGMAVKIC